MKNKTVVFLAILFLLTLCIGLSACHRPAEPLPAPGNLHVEKRILSWDPVENATGYKVWIRGEEYHTTDCRLELYAMTMEGGLYSIEVAALGDQKEYSDSPGAKVSVDLEAPAAHGSDDIFKYTFLEEKAGYEIDLAFKESPKLLGEVVIPDYFGDYPVKRLADHMFSLGQGFGMNSDPFTEAFCNRVTTKLTLPRYLEEISAWAVSGMVQLEEIVIPDSVTQIGNYAFWGNKRMTRVVLPKGLKEIPEGCFSNTALSDIVWPDALESIGFQAFCNETRDYLENGHVASDMFEVVLPDTVKSIEDRAFAGRENLRSVNVPVSLARLEGDIFFGTAWYDSQPEGVVYWGKILYRYKGVMPENTVIEISPTTKGIAGYAFTDVPPIPHPAENLTKIVIPDGVKFLGSKIFYGCSSLTEVVLPRDLERIPPLTFGYCEKLNSIMLPSSIKKIGKNAFLNCVVPIYYDGASFSDLLSSLEDTSESNIQKLELLPIYYYSESQPTKKGLYWHYVDGKPTPWKSEE